MAFGYNPNPVPTRVPWTNRGPVGANLHEVLDTLQHEKLLAHRIEFPVEPDNPAVLVAPLHGDAYNYVDGTTGTVSGTSPQWQTCRFRRGFRAEGDNLITWNITPIPGRVYAGTMFLRFRTLQAFDASLDNIYQLMRVDRQGTNDYAQIMLHYQDLQGYNGVEFLLRSESQHRLVLPNVTMGPDEVHTIAVAWEWYKDHNNGVMAIYFDGRYVRGTSIPGEQYLPANIHRILVGNWVTGQSPANCIIEDVLFTQKFLSHAAILKLHRGPLLVECAHIPELYDPKVVVADYSRQEIEWAVKEYDPVTGRLWGHTPSERHVLLYSDDEGVTKSTFHNFGSGNNIEAVFVVGDYVFVCVGSTLWRSNKSNASFTPVLTLTPGFIIVNGWGHTHHQGKIVVAEYAIGQAADAKAYLSTDYGDSWTVIRTLEPDADHIHAVKYDPYTGKLWLTWGDAIEAIEYSDDDGASWHVVTTSSEEQVVDMVFTETAVIFASDATTGRALLRLYDKRTGTLSRLIPAEFPYLANVYAIHIDQNGVLWLYANNEGNSNRYSSIWLSADLGASAKMVENLWSKQLYQPHKVVETPMYIYIGNNRFTKPLVMTRHF